MSEGENEFHSPPTSLPLEDEFSTYPFRKIQGTFAETPEGDILAGQIRFDRYIPEGISNEEWISILGRDVNNRDHMPLTYGLTRQFLRYSRFFAEGERDEARREANTFAPAEEAYLCLSALQHDQGEAIVGDHMADQKLDEHEVQEREAIGDIIDKYYSGTAVGLEEKMRWVRDNVSFDRESRLGRVFNAIERVGYLRTGLRAFEASGELVADTPHDKELRQGFQWLTNNVLLNQVSKLLEYSDDYTAVRYFLVENRDRITAAFEGLPENVFELYREDEVTGNIEKFTAAKEAWFSSSPYKDDPDKIIPFPQKDTQDEDEKDAGRTA